MRAVRLGGFEVSGEVHVELVFLLSLRCKHISVVVTLRRERQSRGKGLLPVCWRIQFWLQWKETRLNNLTVHYPGQVRLINCHINSALFILFIYFIFYLKQQLVTFTVTAATFMLMNTHTHLHDVFLSFRVSPLRTHTASWVCVQQVIAGAQGLLSTVLSGPPALIIPHRPHLLCLPHNYLFWKTTRLFQHRKALFFLLLYIETNTSFHISRLCNNWLATLPLQSNMNQLDYGWNL